MIYGIFKSIQLKICKKIRILKINQIQLLLFKHKYQTFLLFIRSKILFFQSIH